MKNVLTELEACQSRTVALLLGTLSSREREVFAAMCTGKDSDKIAQLQGVSLSTVHTHRANILQKLGARNAVQLVFLVKRAKINKLRKYLHKLVNFQSQPQTQLGVVRVLPKRGTS